MMPFPNYSFPNYRLRVHAEYDWECQRIGLRFFEREGSNGKLIAVAQPIVMAPPVEGNTIEPAVYLASDVAQQLMDQLWHCGLRPTEGTGSAGSMAATQKHLDDLKTILFHKLGIASPK